MQATDEVHRRFRAEGWRTRLHVFLRSLVLSPATIEEHVPKTGRVLDLACGYGALSLHLALSAPGRSVHGVDMDAKRIAVARRAGAGVQSLSFSIGDIRDLREGKADAIVIIDALHYFPRAVQAEILSACRRALVDGGTLVVRDAVRERSFAFWWNRLHERAMVGLSITTTHAHTLCFLTRDEMIAHLRTAAFEVVRVDRARRWYPYSDTIFIARGGANS